LENSFEPRAFLAASGIRFMAAVAMRVINFAARRLPRVEAKFDVRLAALHIASRQDHEPQQNHARWKEGLGATISQNRSHRPFCFPMRPSFWSSGHIRRCEPLYNDNAKARSKEPGQAARSKTPKLKVTLNHDSCDQTRLSAAIARRRSPRTGRPFVAARSREGERRDW